MSDKAIEVNVSNDTGNSTCKVSFENKKGGFDRTIIPSVIAKKGTSDNLEPVNYVGSELKSYVKNILKYLDVSIDSSTLNDNDRYLVGDAAVTSGMKKTNFDVNDPKGKSVQDLTVILNLALIAGRALQDAFDANKELPTHIEVNANLVTALPIAEGKEPNRLKTYRNRYLSDDSHTVLIKNFKTTISVSIHFNNVLVPLEGETPEYAIQHSLDLDPKLAETIQKDFDNNYPNFKDQVSVEQLLKPNVPVLNLDLGEGTVDFSVFDSKGEINVNASSSLKEGYGNYIELAIDDLARRGETFSSRESLNEFMEQKDSIFNKQRKELVQSAIDERMKQFTDSIATELKKVLKSVDGSIGMIYVYGGGAIPLAKQLRTKIDETTTKFVSVPPVTIFINKKYSRILNEIGLEMILNSVFLQNREG